VAWDGICAGEANTLCKVCGGGPPPPCDPPPANEECEGATDLGVIATDAPPVCTTGSLACALPDCGLFVFGEGNLWLKFTTLEARNVTLSYCGSLNSGGAPIGNAWLNLAVGCPCASFTSAGAFAFSCPDGNVQITWANLAAGDYYYPILRDTANGADGTYNICVSSAVAVAVCPNAKHDCFTTGGPGCSDEDCCNAVCAIDSFCCDVSWDSICVSEAASLCLPPPANDNCENRIAITEGVYPFSTFGAVTDGPPHVACEDGFADQQVGQDIWYNYTASCDGDVTVALCGSSYDTKLAVYDGCSCDVSDANLIDCEDDTCGLQSSITYAAIAGNCYKIRVGGYASSAGDGIMTVTNSSFPCTPPCSADITGDGQVNVNDLLEVINQWGPCP
jgi:hypothetical protein